MAFLHIHGVRIVILMPLLLMNVESFAFDNEFCNACFVMLPELIMQFEVSHVCILYR